MLTPRESNPPSVTHHSKPFACTHAFSLSPQLATLHVRWQQVTPLPHASWHLTSRQPTGWHAAASMQDNTCSGDSMHSPDRHCKAGRVYATHSSRSPESLFVLPGTAITLDPGPQHRSARQQPSNCPHQLLTHPFNNQRTRPHVPNTSIHNSNHPQLAQLTTQTSTAIIHMWLKMAHNTAM